MQRFTSLAFRTVFFLGFLIALPILALPKVSNLIDRLLYDDAPTVVQAPVIQQPAQQIVEPQFAERASPAQFEETLVSEPAGPPRSFEGGLDTLTAAPPLLNPLPTLPPHDVATIDAATGAAQIDAAALARLHQVQERLETLGAQYMVLETVSGSARFRFHCQMLVDGRSTYTREFDATSAHPLEAAETVLSEVEAWRTAALPATTSRE